MTWPKNLKKLFFILECERYQRPVIYKKGNEQQKYFKNPDCAFCYLESESIKNDTDCYQKQNTRLFLLADKAESPEGPTNETLVLLQDQIVRNTLKYTPSSISILINFGVDDQHLQYNADNFKDNCLPNQIWDPFHEKCIMHYCNSKFTLDEITCINQTHEGDQNYNPDPVPITPDVRLNFTVYVSTNGTNDKVDTITKTLLSNFSDTFENALLIPKGRISNVTVEHDRVINTTSKTEIANMIVEIEKVMLNELCWNGTIHYQKALDMADEITEDVTVHVLSVALTLAETDDFKDHTSIDNIVSSCADLIGRDQLNLYINGTPVRIVTIKETAITEESEITEWCRYV